MRLSASMSQLMRIYFQWDLYERISVILIKLIYEYANKSFAK